MQIKNIGYWLLELCLQYSEQIKWHLRHDLEDDFDILFVSESEIGKHFDVSLFHKTL